MHNNDIYENALTRLQSLDADRRNLVLGVMAGLIRLDMAVFTASELAKFAKVEGISVLEMMGAVEYCWLCGWCGYCPETGLVAGGLCEAFRTEGGEQDSLIEGRLAR
jgi:hypothetical protein